MKKIIIIVVLCIFCLCSCSENYSEEENTNTSPADIVETTEETVQETINYPTIELTELDDILISESDLEKANTQYSKFAANLFKNSFVENENGLVSPYSLYSVLSVLANGAANSDKADTKLLLENVLGMTVNDLNTFYGYVSPNLDLTSGLLFNTDIASTYGIKLDENLKKTIDKYYGAAIKEESFSDVNKLITDVNAWSYKQSKGSIPTIIDNSDIKPETILLLLNGLSVDGYWRYSFNPDNTVLQNFNNSDNSKVNVSMMKQTLDGYWKTDNATGFAKNLVSGYTFVGILPNEDVDIKAFVDNIDENSIINMINSFVKYDNVDEEEWVADYHYTNLSFPKFEYSVNNKLDEALKLLGLNSIFDDKTCDFSLFGSDKIYLQDNISQKTSVEINEEKVKMSAITVAPGAYGATGEPGVRQKVYHDVTFDRPFIYALVRDVGDYNNPNYVILFMGAVNNLQNETTVKVENNEKSIGCLHVSADSIKVRSAPTTKGNNQIRLVTEGQEYYVYEIKENEGYTWYRIGENMWIADDGTWIYYGSSCGFS